MISAEKFLMAAENLLNRRGQNDETYMEDPSHWLLVHATKYTPKQNTAGQYYIPTTAMVTDFKIPRGTIHTTLNHIVYSHGQGNWDEIGTLVLAPYNSTAELNGNPLEISYADTYFAPNPDTGLILPPQTRIVTTTSNLPEGTLYEIRGNTTVYKSTDYTPAETETILTIVRDVWKRSFDDYIKYDKWSRGELEDWELTQLLEYSWDKRIKQMYNKAKDKKAFIRGLYAYSREELLSQYVREIAARATAEQMGYRFIQEVYENSDTANTIEKTAEKLGIQGNSSDKGHFNSISSKIEDQFFTFGNQLEHLKQHSKNLDELYNFIAQESRHSNFYTKIVCAIINDTELPLYQQIQNNIKQDYYKKENSIAEYSKNLDIVAQRWAPKANQELKEFRQTLQKMPGYDKFVTRLRELPQFSVTNIIQNRQDYSL